MIFTQKTHVGKVRTNNEDSVFARKMPKYTYLMVADGMGGAAAGEIASKMGVFSVMQYAESLKKNFLDADDLKNAVIYANDQIIGETKFNPKLVGMGTTITLACVNKKSIACAHVGDSSAYLVSKKTIKKLTKDHTYVQSLIDKGMLDKEKAKTYPLKNIITRVVGMEQLEVDIYNYTWNKNDYLLICSDGLTSYVEEDEIFTVLCAKENLDKKADRLINLALERGGSDNISVVVAQND